jgi:hypothetical protein
MLGRMMLKLITMKMLEKFKLNKIKMRFILTSYSYGLLIFFNTRHQEQQIKFITTTASYGIIALILCSFIYRYFALAVYDSSGGPRKLVRGWRSWPKNDFRRLFETMQPPFITFLLGKNEKNVRQG